MYPLRKSCKDVSALVIAREDRPLSLYDRLALRLHMAICDACPRFERQVLMMRSLMKRWAGHDAHTDHDAPKH